MGIIMKFIGISKKNNAQKREHNLLKPSLGKRSRVTIVRGEGLGTRLET